jgi:hypothetical protein
MKKVQNIESYCSSPVSKQHKTYTSAFGYKVNLLQSRINTT